MELKPGAKPGPYEIVSAIGRGGMGEVWKARDTRLHRDVAIKTSRVGFSGRFQKEAQAIAALNHPNICTLYDVGRLFGDGVYRGCDVGGADCAGSDST